MGRPVTNRATKEFVECSIKHSLPSNCWLWQRYIQSMGYGQAEIAGRIWLAHRLAWTLWHGPIPKGLMVLHRCDTPACVNPEHLFLGTARDNMQDAINKGRWDPRAIVAHTRKPRRRKLTDDQVRMIRAGIDTDRGLAIRFGVGVQTVRDVRLGRTKRLVV